MTESVFAKYEDQNWPFRFHGTLLVGTIAGGTPSTEKTAEGWLRSKLAAKDDVLRAMVAETMVERAIGEDEAVELVTNGLTLNGFKRDEQGLYIEGRQLKAALKEAASVAANSGKLTARGWGTPTDASYKKGLKGWLPEHVFVVEDRLHLGVTEPTGITQRFVHSRYGAAISYEEYVEDAVIEFTVETDFEFTDAQWATIWLAGERQGIGASRSQGFGRYKVIGWERVIR